MADCESPITIGIHSHSSRQSRQLSVLPGATAKVELPIQQFRVQAGHHLAFRCRSMPKQHVVPITRLDCSLLRFQHGRMPTLSMEG